MNNKAMKRTWILAILAIAVAPATAFADPGKGESGQRRERLKELRKQQEKTWEQQEKRIEKERERAEKRLEKEREQREEAWERQEEEHERYWDEIEERRERAEERAEDWWEERDRRDRRQPYRGYPPRYESYDDEDFQTAPRPHYRSRSEAPHPEDFYEDPPRYDDSWPYNHPQWYDHPPWYEDGVEGIYTPFGYYEEYRQPAGRGYRPGPEARGRIGPLRFEVWDD